MKNVLKSLQSDKGLLWFILIIAALLRFYDAFEIPYTHDELSAYYRLQFDSFNELIDKGVKVDGHPALVQVFLYYWTSIFGFSEFMVKLPFLILGIASVPLSYSITKKWFNSTSALIVAAFIASLQFPVMFSQIARPYISGLVLILLLVKYWSQFLFEDSRKNWSFLGMVLAASLATYNHYFSLLLAVIIGFSGLLFVTKQTIKQYVFGLIAVIILFLPHVNIFLFQFSGQGLDWLGKPNSSFLLEHLKFVFHFSFWVYSLAIALLVFGIYQSKSIRLSKLQWVILSWFLLPILIGVTYSIYVKPVIQYSMLLFSFPFLLIFLFSFIKPLKFTPKALIVLLILGVNISTLIWEREYYQLFYSQPFEQFSNITQNFALGDYTSDKPKSYEIVLAGDTRYIDYYFKTKKPRLGYVPFDHSLQKPLEFKSFLTSCTSEFIVLGNIPNQLVMMAKEHFPNLVFQELGFTYSVIILSKNESSSFPNSTLYYSSQLNFDKENKDWNSSPKVLESDNYVSQLDSTTEFGPSLELDLDHIISSRHSLIEMKLDFKTNHLKNGLIVCSITKGEKTISWSAVSLDEFTNPALFNTWQRGYFSVDLTLVFKHSTEISGTKLKVNFWNMNKQKISLDNFNVEIVKGNSYQYGTIEPID